MGDGTIYSGNYITYPSLKNNNLSPGVGKGISLNDKIEMYILKVHFTKPKCFTGINVHYPSAENRGLFIVAYNIDCSVIADFYYDSWSSDPFEYMEGIVDNEYLMYAKLNGDPTTIGTNRYLFRSGYSLQRVDYEIPPKSLGNYFFQSCYSLSDSNLPDLSQVTNLGNRVFDQCHSIKKLNLPSVTIIPSESFTSMDCLEEIIFENVTTINSNNFKNGFYNLSKITLPKIKSMDYYCFNKSKITKIDLSECESLGNNLFCNMPYLEELDLGNVTSIGNYNFQNCYNLKKINAPHLTTIGLSNFCVTNISEVYFPVLNSIGTSSFNKNYKLTTVNLPSLKTLGDCFNDNYNLTTVDLPLLETSGNSFTCCYNLRSINLQSLTTLSSSDGIGHSCYSLKNIIAPNIDLSLTNIFRNSYMIK